MNKTDWLNSYCENEDFDRFKMILGTMTANEAAKYIHSEGSHVHSSYMLWTVCVTWGFEIMWAFLSSMTPEELKAFNEENSKRPGGEGELMEIPDNFNGDVPLHRVGLWAPQDHYDRLSK